MRLSLRRLRLQHEVKYDNYNAIVKLRQQNLFKVAKALDLAPDHSIVRIIYEAIGHNVKLLKTKDQRLLSRAAIIESAFTIKVLAI